MRVSKPAETITGVALQQFVERLTEREAKECLKILIATLSTGRVDSIRLENVDYLLRMMVE